jgi:hypothetical protein
MLSATRPANLPSLGTTLPVPEAIEQQRSTQKTNMVSLIFYPFFVFYSHRYSALNFAAVSERLVV